MIRQKTAMALAFLLVFWSALRPSQTSAAENAPPGTIRRILILNEVNASYPAIGLIDDAIRESLQGSKYRIEIYREYLETALFPEAADQKLIRDFLVRKYHDRRPDVIITVGSSPLQLMANKPREYFEEVPVVYCLPNGAEDNVKLEGFTGVRSGIEAAATLNAALELLPNTKHVLIVGGAGNFDRQELEEVKEQVKEYTNRVDFSYATDLPMPKILERLRSLPPDYIVLFTSMARDSAGTYYSSRETAPLINSASSVPVFTLFDVYIGNGEVGGNLSQVRAQGTMAGKAVLQILDGVKPSDIPVAKAPNSFVFDWRALNRWRLDEIKIPAGSVVLNRQLTPWELYRWYFFAGAALILIEALLISGLIVQWKRAREAESELEITYDRLRLAVEAGNSVGWDWDIKSGRDRWFGDLETIFGIRSQTYSGHVDDFRRRVHAEDRETVWRAVDHARTNHLPYLAEFRVVRDDGNVRWITARGTFYYTANGDPERMLGMAVDITDRKRAEDALRMSETFSKEVVLRSPAAMVVTRGPEHRNELINDKFTELFGYTIEDVPDEDHWWPLAYPDPVYREELKAIWRARVAKALAQQSDIDPIEASVRCKDGSSRHIEFHFASLGDTSLVSFVDLTDRERAQAAIRESEERFRLVANTAPVLIWTSGTDKLCDYFNRPWLEFTGRTLEEELGEGWAKGIHEEDVRRVLDTYTSAFDRRERFKMEYRLRRHDGEYRWIVDRGVPRFNPDGSFVGYVGCCIDITENKLAADALATLSGQLIAAQEEERRRVAREIHDDYQQRLAMVANDIDLARQQLSDTPEHTKQRLRHIWNEISELTSDLHSLSHRLHSSTLETLGLVAGVSSFCREFQQQQALAIDFTHENVPRGISPDIALCLFRVTQEALRNVKRHSGANQAEVRLEGRGEELYLRVSDRGVGFDPKLRSPFAGIGIRSMEERLRILGGNLEVHSQRSNGTTIHVRVPFKVARQSAS